MTSANERKAAERQRRKDAGLVRCEVWVKPHHVAMVQAFAAQKLEQDKALSDMAALDAEYLFPRK
jgi:hypothetical protein